MKASSKSFDISYVSVDSIQEGVGASQIIPLLKALANQGKTISLTTCEKKEPSKALRFEISSAKIDWKIVKYGKNGALHGTFRLIKLAKHARNARIIHARSDVPAVAVALRFPNAKILWDVRSLWADQRKIIDSKGWNQITTYAARKLEKVAARKSLAMTTLTQAVVPILEKRYIKLPTIRAVIPTCTQVDIFTCSPLPPGDKLCLLPGTFNNFYDLDLMRTVISEIRKITMLKVIWVKPQESTTEILNVGENLTISAAYSEMPGLISNSHFGIVLCKRDNLEVLTAVAPTKVAEFLASGRPILVSKGIGDLDYLVSKYKVGVVVEPHRNMQPILLEFLELLNDPEVHMRCRKLAEEMFSMSKAVEKYNEVYAEMAKHE